MSASPATFSPYQPPPEPHSPSLPPGRRGYQSGSAPASPSRFPPGEPSAAAASSSSAAAFNPTGVAGVPDAERVNKYETSVSARIDIESALCYALGCVTGILFLIIETKNDFVRFHAWQSVLTFIGLLLVQFFFSLFSSTMVWLLFFVEVGLAGWLGFKAYTNSDSLDRYQLPYIGEIASQWVDSE
ncbi:hypothetical protein HDU88_000218 [Geranomyces variabilis]|nr:hypothetical protein HDU88_000218 [Geranomyces variabilis]